jgi:endonuclease/exonuclease/phosphatase family metal-dependent hydrolase
MRIATFNLESLDLPPKATMTLEARAEVLRPALERLRADILCLQEVNGQHVPGQRDRTLAALDQLLAGTRYAGYARVATTGPAGHGAADVHNLVTLSRYPIRAHRQVLHDLAEPMRFQPITADPRPTGPEPVRFDRPMLVTEIVLPDGRGLTAINLHLRAPLASSVPGQKLEPFVWKTVGGWAEGYFLSALRRSGQALELRLLLEQMFDQDAHSLIAIAGDFNAEDHEVPLKIIVGAEEDTGNGTLSSRSLVLLDRALPEDRRWSVLHHGRPQMLDHILVSRALHASFSSIDVHNETLSDEVVGYARNARTSGSGHAAVVAEFAVG